MKLPVYNYHKLNPNKGFHNITKPNLQYIVKSDKLYCCTGSSLITPNKSTLVYLLVLKIGDTVLITLFDELEITQFNFVPATKQVSNYNNMIV